MQHVIGTLDISRVDTVGTPDAPLQPTHNAGNNSGRAPAHLNTVRPGRRVKAGDLHPGYVMQQYDWSLHVRKVEVGDVSVAIAVTEYGFPLHYAADERIALAA